MLTTIDKVLFLMRSPITAECTTDALSRLAGASKELSLSPSQALFSVGDAAEALWIVLDGAIRLEGIEVPSRLVSPGEVAGGLALLAGVPHQATATAVVSTRALRIDRSDLADLLDEDGEFARALFAGLLRALKAASPAALVA
jgi:CRP-like cAMP-binding protein